MKHLFILTLISTTLFAETFYKENAYIITEAMEKSRPSFQLCYMQYINSTNSNPNLKHVMLEMEINADGSIKKMQLQKSVKVDKSLKTCILTAANKVRFPKLKGNKILKANQAISFQDPSFKN